MTIPAALGAIIHGGLALTFIGLIAAAVWIDESLGRRRTNKNARRGGNHVEQKKK